MIWDDEGFLLSKVNYSENSVIVSLLTLNHGRCSGIVYGGSSRKIKKYLQIGNKLFLSFKSNKEGKIGYFKIELIKAVAPFFFGNKKKISCILSAVSILKIVLPEEQVNKKIFYSLENLISALYKKKWIIFYIYWEQLLVSESGYDINLFKENKFNVNVNGISFKVPKLFNKKSSIHATKNEINEALIFNKNLIVSNFLDGKIIKIPRSRFTLEKYYN